jgi:hypothetical protein
MTHRELDAAIRLPPSDVQARWVGTDTPDAIRTSQADGVWVVPGSPYRIDAVVYAAITSARTSAAILGYLRWLPTHRRGVSPTRGGHRGRRSR